MFPSFTINLIMRFYPMLFFIRNYFTYSTEDLLKNQDKFNLLYLDPPSYQIIIVFRANDLHQIQHME